MTLLSQTPTTSATAANPPYTSVPLDDFQSVFGETSTEVSSSVLGGRIVSFSDEFFAEASNLLKVHPSVSLKGTFGPKGALYDGWETRRHVSVGKDTSADSKDFPKYGHHSDWVIVALGPTSAQISGFDIDTANFTGNEGPAADVWGIKLDVDGKTPEEIKKLESSLDAEDSRWEKLLPVVPLGPNSRHLFQIPTTTKSYSHIKLHMIPDGGIGRFRVYGTALPPAAASPPSAIDLAYALNGGRVVAQSNQHFGVASNLLLPGRGVDMGDGWETRRSRDPKHSEWAVIKLGEKGWIEHVEIDTAYHMGNFPYYAKVEAINSEENVPPSDSSEWVTIVSKLKTGPHRQHFCPAENAKGKLFTHVRLTILPDGGLKRLRVIGYQASSAPPDAAVNTPTSTASAASDELVLECLPLTYEAFAPYGSVIQGYSSSTAVPRGLAKTEANQGTACKVHKMSPISHDYGKDGLSTISVVRAQPQVQTGTVIDVKVLENHPHTTQAFIPLGKAEQKSSNNNSNGSFVAIVALPGTDGKPDLSTIRAFLVPPYQGVSYGAGIWHHPLMTVDASLDYALVETRHKDAETAVTEMLTPPQPWAKLIIPRLPVAEPKQTETAKAAVVETSKFSLNGLKTALSGHIRCKPLTSEGFAPYGNVIQAWKRDEVPKGVKVVVNDQFKVTRFCDLAPITESYPAEANASTNISVFRATPREGLHRGKPFPVHFLERHPFTEQTFMPMGLGSWEGKGEESLPGGCAYVTIVAQDKGGKPDPSTVEAFFCETNQGINYHAGVWHHPMLVVGGAVDLACVETQIHPTNDVRDCELLEYKEPIAIVDIST